MKSVLEMRHDAEVSTAPTKRPEEVAVLILGRLDGLTVRGHDMCSDEIVDGEAELALKVADPATQSQPRDPRISEGSARARQTEGLGRCVVLLPGGAPTGDRRLGI